MKKQFKLSEKIEKYEEPINMDKIERVVRQAHMEYYDDYSYCIGCVKRAILETIKECKKDVKEFIRLLKENKIVLDIDKSEDYKEGFCDGVLFMMSKIDRLAGDFN